jgi:hypothetical protein
VRGPASRGLEKPAGLLQALGRKDLGIYHRVFGCRIEFDAEFNGIEEVNDTAGIRGP